jgi:phosphinothricin acetyltransferase
VKISRAFAIDAPAVAAIMNGVISDSTATFTTVTKTNAQVMLDIQPPQSCLVVKIAEKVVGYARYFPFRAGPGYAHVVEYSIALTHEAQGKGISRALLNALCTLAKQDGKTQMIGAVSGDNQSAIKFHLDNGFEQVGHLPNVGRKWGKSLDLIFMQKRL